MDNPVGAFVWHELATTDLTAGRAFYADVVGWTQQDSGMSGMEYWLFLANGAMTAGAMTLPDQARAMGAPSNWLGYVGVADVDVATDKARKLGARVFVEPKDIPNTGRFSVIADPQGATIALFRWAGEMAGDPPPPNAPGRVGWNELYAVDWAQAFDFYAEMFGWTKGQTMDMGPMGVYQLFRHGDRDIGGMMNKPPQMPVPAWTYYFIVTDIDAAVARVKAGGGTVLNGPMQVPGGGWIAQAIDPQGAMFALTGPRQGG